MSKNCLGGISFDAHEWNSTGGNSDTDIALDVGISLCDGNYGGGAASDIRGSRWGSHFQAVSEHTNRSDAFITRVEDFISYYCWAKNTNYTVTDDGDQSFIYSHFAGADAPNGAVRIMLDIYDVAENYYVVLQYKAGGNWTILAGSPNPIPIAYSSLDCWALQVDLTNGDAGKCEARVMHYDAGGACPNGAGGGSDTWHEEITWTAVAMNGAILAAGVLATPALGFIQVGGKGTTNIQMTLSSYWVYDADSAANLPDQELDGDDYETWATYCKADDTVTNWAATGGGCAGLWRVLCDTEEPDATVNGYISVAGNGSAETYLGEVADIGAANGNEMQTLDGVGVTAILDYSPSDQVNDGVDDIGLSYNGTASWKTGEFGRDFTNETTKYAFWDKNPEGDAWVVGDLAGLLAGVKSDAGNDGRCYGLIIHLVGSGGRRPTNDLEACPTGARRIFVYHG